MTWMNIDDRVLEHPKLIRLVKLGGGDAVLMWLGLLAHCAQNLTDGRIVYDMISEVRGPKTKAKRSKSVQFLIETGLILVEKSGDILLHDYLDWAESRDKVTERKAMAKARKDRYNQKASTQTVGSQNGDGTVTGTRSERVQNGDGTESRARGSTPLHSTIQSKNPLTPKGTEAVDSKKTSKPDAELVKKLDDAWWNRLGCNFQDSRRRSESRNKVYRARLNDGWQYDELVAAFIVANEVDYLNGSKDGSTPHISPFSVMGNSNKIDNMMTAVKARYGSIDGLKRKLSAKAKREKAEADRREADRQAAANGEHVGPAAVQALLAGVTAGSGGTHE